MAHVSSLSSITSSELSDFVQREIEPDMAYIQRCNDIVDLLCQFMQNSFPRELRPSEVRKVNMAHSHFYWFCSNYHSSSFLICQCLNKIFKSSLKVYRMLSSYFYRQNKKTYSKSVTTFTSLWNIYNYYTCTFVYIFYVKLQQINHIRKPRVTDPLCSSCRR